jgi:hypothetical protein
VDAAHRVEVRRPGCALEDSAAGCHLEDQKVERLGDGRMRQLAGDHALHLREAVHRQHHLARDRAGAGAALEVFEHPRLVGQPGFEFGGLRVGAG